MSAWSHPMWWSACWRGPDPLQGQPPFHVLFMSYWLKLQEIRRPSCRCLTAFVHRHPQTLTRPQCRGEFRLRHAAWHLVQGVDLRQGS